MTNRTLAASLLAGVLALGIQSASAQSNAPSSTATRPAKVLPNQTSVPGNGPPATTSQTTGEASRDPTIKKMNDDEKRKVDTKGK
ncbi:hypothetical protein JQ553_10790 [Bradyrhizobium lablabi]|nr:hypothetical protein [Bradyrhizobium lablabi]